MTGEHYDRFLDQYDIVSHYDDPLPGTVVDRGDRQYVVHGIPHDPNPARQIVSDEVKETIEDRLQQYMDSHEDILFEEDLDIWLENVVEDDIERMDDKSHAHRQMDEYGLEHLNRFRYSDKPGTLEFWVRGMLGQEPEFPTAGTPTAFMEEPLREGTKDPDQLTALQDYCVSWYQDREDPDTIEAERPEDYLTHEARDQRMADYAVDHETDGDTVHLIVGASHQPGIVKQLATMDEDYQPAIDPEHSPDLWEHERKGQEEEMKYAIAFNLAGIGANVGTLTGMMTAVAGLGSNDPGLMALGASTTVGCGVFDSFKGNLIDSIRDRR